MSAEDACRDYLHFSSAETPRGEINKRLARLSELLKESLTILKDDTSEEAVSLLAYPVMTGLTIVEIKCGRVPIEIVDFNKKKR